MTSTTTDRTPDDLHKTEAQYSEIQPQPLKESEGVDTCSKQHSHSKGILPQFQLPYECNHPTHYESHCTHIVNQLIA